MADKKIDREWLDNLSAKYAPSRDTRINRNMQIDRDVSTMLEWEDRRTKNKKQQD